MSLARLAPDSRSPGAFQRSAARHGLRHQHQRFGRAQLRVLDPVDPAPSLPILSGDLRLFAGTFVVGFLFVSMLIA